jgi:hypothetical protein
MTEQEAALEAARARLDELAKLPPAERFDRLVRAGIITPDGRLADHLPVRCIFGFIGRWQDYTDAPLCPGHAALLTDAEREAIAVHFEIEREAERQRGDSYNGKHAVSGSKGYHAIWERLRDAGAMECRRG